MVLGISFWIGMLLVALALAGCLYELIAIVALVRFFGQPVVRAADWQGATLLKPLHGAEPCLTQNLASFLDQDYPGPLQMVCGLSDRSDAAAAVAEQLRAVHPARDIALVVKSTSGFANGKIANLTNMLPSARHGILLLSDSDMAVSSDYVSTILGALARPGVGGVTCAYRGRGDAGFWSILSAGCISYVGLPGVILGYVAGMARPCMGSTIALSRETLSMIGGFEGFANVLADDYAIGAAIAQTGQSVVIAPLLLVHGCSEPDFSALWRQKLRWSATIRGVAPLRHLGSIVTYPLALALLAALFVPTIALPIALAALAIRLAMAVAVDYRARERSAPYWMLPAIEVIEFLAFVASFVARKIDWRGSRLTMQRDGRIAA
jgi:ceramide glucosyltransferase